MKRETGKCAIFKFGLVLVCTAAALTAGCDGGGGAGGGSGTQSSADLDVFGNAPVVDGREQIMAGNNNGRFQIHLRVPQHLSDQAKVFFTNSADSSSDQQRQKVIDLKCLELRSCTFDVVADCTLSPDNKVQCSGDAGIGAVDMDLPAADLTQLLTGNSTDLFAVLEVKVAGEEAADEVVPVTVTVQNP